MDATKHLLSVHQICPVMFFIVYLTYVVLKCVCLSACKQDDSRILLHRIIKFNKNKFITNDLDIRQIPLRMKITLRFYTYSRGATRPYDIKRGQVVHLTSSFLMMILVKYIPLPVRKCMFTQNYQSRKGKTSIFKNILLAGMNTHQKHYKY